MGQPFSRIIILAFRVNREWRIQSFPTHTAAKQALFGIANKYNDYYIAEVIEMRDHTDPHD